MPPSFRDRVRARAREAARRATQGIADAARKGIRRVFTRPEPEPAPRPEPVPSKPPRRPPQAAAPPPRKRSPQQLPKPPRKLPLPVPPRSEVDDGEPSQGQLPQQVKSLAAQLDALRKNEMEILQRLRELGYERVADAVSGVPEPPQAGAVPPSEDLPELPTPPEGAVPPAPPSLPQAPTPQRPPKPSPDEQDREIDQLPPAEQRERRYPLSGSSIQIPFDSDPATVFDLLSETWRRASPGSRRDPQTHEPLDATPPYAPDAVAIGTPLDPGTQIPPSAMVSRGAFVRWCKQSGYGEGLSVEVDGLMARPGRVILPAVARARDGGKVPRRGRITVPGHLEQAGDSEDND